MADQFALDLVREWHDALNERDSARLASVVSEDLEIGGPRGMAHGRDTLLDWMTRSGIQMVPTYWYQRDATVIVCQRVTWPTEDGTPGVPQNVATVFVIRDQQIVRIARHPGVADAFGTTGLSEMDHVQV